MSRSRPTVATERREHIASTIRKYREAAGYDQKELSGILHLSPNAVGMWERRQSRPDLDTIPKLCRTLQMPITEFFGVDPELTLDRADSELLALFHSLEARDQKLALNLMMELQRKNMEAQRRSLRQRVNSLVFYEQASAAGFGAPMEETSEDRTVYVYQNPASDRATSIIKVNGESMEPKYPDGCKVYVQEVKELNYGDVGIFIVNGTSLMKVYEKDGLHSLNPDQKTYPVIKIGIDDNVVIFGKVLGIVGDFEILTGESLREVEEAFAEEEDRNE